MNLKDSYVLECSGQDSALIFTNGAYYSTALNGCALDVVRCIDNRRLSTSTVNNIDIVQVLVWTGVLNLGSSIFGGRR